MIKLSLTIFCLTIAICWPSLVLKKSGVEFVDLDHVMSMKSAVDRRKDVKQDPMVDLNLFQGDIMMPENPKVKNKNGGIHLFGGERWKNNIVPYIIDGNSGYSFIEDRMITSAMFRIQSISCIRFQEKRNEMSYVVIRRDPKDTNSCASMLGQIGGEQYLHLGYGCFTDGRTGLPTAGIVMHEFLHLLGFLHEQARPDRDGYVQIIERNIADDPLAKAQFTKFNTNNLGAPYDTCSIMHYGQYHASRGPGLQTIRVIKPNNCTTEEIGHASYLSNYDIRKLNTLYSCQGYPQVKSTTVTNPTNPGNQNCVDKYTRCSEFTPYCDHPKFVNQMNVYCALSCGQCQGSENPTQGNCADKFNRCEDMMKQGLCWSHPQWVQKNCANTCKVCHKVNV